VETAVKLFGEFETLEKRNDGTLYVEGFASTGQRDSDGEIVLPSAMRDALPAYMKFGTVREQHDVKKAAGTAVFAEVQEDGRTRFGAVLVDPITIKKVEHKVLKGFSIYGKALQRNPKDRSVVEKLRLSAIDVVDRPANPDSVIDLMKFDDPAVDVVVQPIDAAAMTKYFTENAADVRKALGITEPATPVAKADTPKEPAMPEPEKKVDDVKKADTPAANPLGDVLVKAFGDALKADPSLAEKLGITLKPATAEERIEKLEAANAELPELVAAAVSDVLAKALGMKPATPASARKGVLRSVSKTDDVAKVEDTSDDDLAKLEKTDPVAAWNKRADVSRRAVGLPNIG